MTTPAIPPEWASNANYSAGPDTGTATKVDPASAANGYIRGVAAAAQAVNYELNLCTRADRRALQIACLQLRRVDLEGTAITDTAESMGAVQRNQGTPIVAVKTAQAFGIGDAARFTVQGVPASITSAVVDAATDGTRIIALGAGGNHNTFSDDDGVTWTAGGAPSVLTERYIVWAGFLSKFLIASGTSHVYRSSNGVAWTDASAGIDSVGGLAVCSVAGGRVLALTISGTTPAFRRSADAASWSDTLGTVANDTAFDEKGTVCGNAGSLIYHCGRLNSGATIQVSVSADGDSWFTLASLTPQGSASFASRPRIMMCQNTGLLIIAAPTSGNQCALYASTNGTDWVGPTVLFPNPATTAFALAGGRLFYAHDDMLFASDGIGY